jgi:hypothetical protein
MHTPQSPHTKVANQVLYNYIHRKIRVCAASLHQFSQRREQEVPLCLPLVGLVHHHVADLLKFTMQ